jgi:DNA-binding NarL/FixJ family response regulator
MPIRVVVVDDHMVFREGLRALLGRVDDIEIVGEAATTQESHPMCRRGSTRTCCSADLNLPGNGGEVATTTILAAHPEVAVLVLTMHSDDGHLRHALNAVPAAALKTPTRTAVIRAIVAVHEGQAIFDPGIAPRVIAATGAAQAKRPSPSLTRRSARSLDRTRPRATQRRDSARMGISIKTVQNNVSTILLRWAPLTAPRPLPLPATREWAAAPRSALPAPRAAI